MDEEEFGEIAHLMFMIEGATPESIGRILKKLHDENVDSKTGEFIE